MLVVGYYFMREFVAVAVEHSYVAVGLKWVGCDYHDSSVEVVQVVD